MMNDVTVTAAELGRSIRGFSHSKFGLLTHIVHPSIGPYCLNIAGPATRHLLIVGNVALLQC